jgi:hypothetical protein
MEACRELIIWTPHGPFGPVTRDKSISDRPEKYAKSLEGALDEVDKYWRDIFEFLSLPQEPSADTVGKRQIVARQVFEPLGRLRSALHECKDLIAQQPVTFVESYKNAAWEFYLVLTWVVSRNGSNKVLGLSKGGPAMTFICNGLTRLGWTFTEDAVLQFLKRRRKDHATRTNEEDI